MKKYVYIMHISSEYVRNCIISRGHEEITPKNQGPTSTFGFAPIPWKSCAQCGPQ